LHGGKKIAYHRKKKNRVRGRDDGRGVGTRACM